MQVFILQRKGSERGEGVLDGWEEGEGEGAKIGWGLVALDLSIYCIVLLIKRKRMK